MSAPTATPVSVRELSVRWRHHGDRHAREALVQRFLPLARNLAVRYTAWGGEPFDDLFQVASLALVKAVDRYDPERAVPFASFAAPTILGELKRYFRDSGWCVRVPRGMQELVLRTREASGSFRTNG